MKHMEKDDIVSQDLKVRGWFLRLPINLFKFKCEEEKKKNDILVHDSEVGDWLLLEIFRRLPLKPLFKFKCVSKRWFSLISDPSLPSSRTDTAMYTLLCRHMSCQTWKWSFNMKVESHSELESTNLQLGFVPTNPEEVQFMAVDNGLLLSCERSESGQCYYVSNPLTGQWVALPELPRNHRQPSAVGFLVGSDSFYKVFVINRFNYDHLKLDLIDSRTRQWRSSTVFLSHPVPKGIKSGSGVLYRGALHWVSGLESSKILAYDPTMHELQGDDYRCRVFASPRVDGDHRHVEFILGLSGGELRYVVSPSFRASSRFIFVWLLKDYDSAEWSLEHKIVKSEMRLSGLNLYFNRVDNTWESSTERYFLGPWKLNPVDKDMLYLVATSGGVCPWWWLASYSISARTLKHLCTHKTLPLPSMNARRPGQYLYPRDIICAFPFVFSPWTPTL